MQLNNLSSSDLDIGYWITSTHPLLALHHQAYRMHRKKSCVGAVEGTFYDLVYCRKTFVFGHRTALAFVNVVNDLQLHLNLESQLHIPCQVSGRDINPCSVALNKYDVIRPGE